MHSVSRTGGKINIVNSHHKDRKSALVTGSKKEKLTAAGVWFVFPRLVSN